MHVLMLKQAQRKLMFHVREDLNFENKWVKVCFSHWFLPSTDLSFFKQMNILHVSCGIHLILPIQVE